MNYWWTSDYHFSHFNIIRYCKRPFTNTQDMDRALIQKYNEKVKDDDICYILGDVAMCGPTYREYLENIIQQLNGNKHLILGNHDRFKPADYIEMGFRAVHTSLELQDHKLVLIHDPVNSIVAPEKTFVVGHVHDMWLKDNNAINIGVDAHNFYPVNLTRVRELEKMVGHVLVTK